MNLLALDTSSDACSVALMVDGNMIHDHQLAVRKHTELILPMVDGIMSDAELQISDLDGIVYGRGPGSFTGVRVSVSLTQGLALGADIGVLGISSLQAVAQSCLREHDDKQVLSCIDARMNEVYFCCYQSTADGLMDALIDEQLCAPSAIFKLSKLATSHKQPTSRTTEWVAFRWAGSGADRYAGEITPALNLSGGQIRTGCLPQARDLLSLALPFARSGSWQDPAMALPCYLRNKVALTTQERQAAAESNQPRT